MADISKITLPDNTTYNIKDNNARNFTNTPYYEQDEEALMFQLGDSYMIEEQDNQPYLFRAAGGSADIGNREYDKIVGGTVAWNQLVRDEVSINETDFADIVTIDDAVEDVAGVKVKIEPVQDLHGYDHPWPAGGGVNKLKPNLTDFNLTTWLEYNEITEKYTIKQGTGVVPQAIPVDYNIPANTEITVTVFVESGQFTNNSGNSTISIGGYHIEDTEKSWQGVVSLPRDTNLAGKTYTTTVTTTTELNSFEVFIYSAPTITTDIVFRAQIEFGTNNSPTWHPYSNICPITGFDGLTVWDDPVRGGTIDWNQKLKALIQTNWSVPRTENSTFSNGVATFVANAQYGGVQHPNVGIIKDHKYLYGYRFMPTTANTAIRINVALSGSNMFFSADTNVANQWNDAYIIQNCGSTGIAAYSIQDKRTANWDQIKVKDAMLIDLTQMFGSTIADYIYSLEQANIGAGVAWFKALFPADYYPYNDGETTTVSAVNGGEYRRIPISWQSSAGTVYGGTLDVTTGQLVVDMAEVDLGTLNWTTGSSGRHSTTDVSNIKGVPNTQVFSALCSNYQSVSGNTVSNKDQTIGMVNGYLLQINDSAYNGVDAATFKTAMDGVQLVYELATPINYILTPTEVRTLLGTNNVWADTGDLALTYTGTDEYLTLKSGRKYLTRISGTDSMLLGSGQEITVGRGTNNVFDITQMFGTTIADYIYSLETATLGTGVAWFRKLFPKSYYEYNPGELMSVQAVAHKLVGFNAWDEEWQLGIINTTTGEEIDSSSNIRSKNYIHVIPGATYYFKLGTTDISNNVVFYDAEKNYMTTLGEHVDDTFTVPENAHYMKFYMSTNYGSTYLSNICINLSGNGERDGEYEEYNMHSYPLDSSLTLRGIPKLDANNQLYYDGDEYQADGTVTRKYGIVNLGTLTWRYNSSIFYAAAFGGYAPAGNYNFVGNLICPKYTISSRNALTNKDKSISIHKSDTTYLSVNDTAYTDAAAFKAAMSGVYLLYELATPTTETAEPYDNPQIVDPEGTEEYITTSIVFVGHETKY